MMAMATGHRINVQILYWSWLRPFSQHRMTEQLAEFDVMRNAKSQQLTPVIEMVVITIMVMMMMVVVMMMEMEMVTTMVMTMQPTTTDVATATMAIVMPAVLQTVTVMVILILIHLTIIVTMKMMMMSQMGSTCGAIWSFHMVLILVILITIMNVGSSAKLFTYATYLIHIMQGYLSTVACVHSKGCPHTILMSGLSFRRD